MFSNSTEGDMFTDQWCEHCRFAYRGDEVVGEAAAQLCDEAAVIIFGLDPPAFLRKVEMTRADPTGVVCKRFERVR